MIFIGIDPSFSGTGLCFVTNGELSFATVRAEQKGVYKYNILLPEAQSLAKRVVIEMKSHLKDQVPNVICQEYPVLASRPGGILAVLMAFLWQEIKESFPNTSYYLVPSMAIKSLTKLKTGSKLTEFVKNSINHSHNINQDEASAYVLTVIGKRIKEKQYKNSFIEL